MTNSAVCESLALIATLTVYFQRKPWELIESSQNIFSVRAVESQHFFFFLWRHLTLQFSAPVYPLRCSILCPFCLGICLLVPSARLLDISSLSVPVSLKPCFPYSSSDSPSMCVCVSVCVCVCFGHNVTAPCPLCTRMGPLSAHVSVCVFPARRAGFLWLLQFAHTLVLVSDRVKQTQWEIKPEEAVITCVSKQILKERLFNMQWPENLAKAYSIAGKVAGSCIRRWVNYDKREHDSTHRRQEKDKIMDIKRCVCHQCAKKGTVCAWEVF